MERLAIRAGLARLFSVRGWRRQGVTGPFGDGWTVRAGIWGGVATASLIGGLLVGIPVAEAQPAVKKPTGHVTVVASRPDEVSARVTARVQGRRVEGEALRTETSSTWVNPDGTMTSELHAAPVRFRDRKGAWHNVNLSLGNATDGSLTPAASKRRLHLWG